MNRNGFIKLTAALGAGLFACKLIPKHEEEKTTASSKKISDYGIQLYSLRDDMPKNPKGVLEAVAKAGYKKIESYDGSLGMWWGMKPAEFRDYVASLGMTLVASHMDFFKDMERKVDEAASAGLKYLVCPWLDPLKTIDESKQKAAVFNEWGKLCREHGMKFAYHNHDHEFDSSKGFTPMQIFLDETDPSIVDFEIDCYWVVTAKQDPSVWLKNNPGRFKLCHIKDRKKDATGRDASCILGTGSIDYRLVLKTAMETGVKEFLVEQELYETTAMDAMKANADYMAALAI